VNARPTSDAPSSGWRLRRVLRRGATSCRRLAGRTTAGSWSRSGAGRRRSASWSRRCGPSRRATGRRSSSRCCGSLTSAFARDGSRRPSVCWKRSTGTTAPSGRSRGSRWHGATSRRRTISSAFAWRAPRPPIQTARLCSRCVSRCSSPAATWPRQRSPSTGSPSSQPTPRTTGRARSPCSPRAWSGPSR
jgi:hypothetical protein